MQKSWREPSLRFLRERAQDREDPEMAKILVVDDDSAVRSLMVKTLEAAGHQICAASDGLEALGIIYAESFDLAVLDVVLPHVSGTGLLNVIRQRSPRTMVVMISGQADLDSTIESLRNGAYDFINKPVEKEDLGKTVQNALEERRLMRNSGYVYKDLRRQDKYSIKKGILYAIFDSLLAGLSVYLAFLGQLHLFKMLDRPFFMGQTELIKLSLGLAFCYAFSFVFKRGYRTDLIGSGLEFVGQLWKNVTRAYLLFLVILFLTRDMYFAAARLAIGLGYILGFLLILANRLVIIPGAMTRIRREGKKNIIIVGSGKPAARVTRQPLHRPEPGNAVGYIDRVHSIKDSAGPNARIIASHEDADRVILTDDVEELYIAGDAFSATEILNLLDRFRGRKLRVVVLGPTDEASHQAETPVGIQ
jgi:FixJ family two-component response regulator